MQFNGRTKSENIKTLHNESQMYEDITIEEIINAYKRTYKWKSPGIDKITNKSHGCKDQFLINKMENCRSKQKNLDCV